MKNYKQKLVSTAVVIWAAGVEGNKIQGLPEDIWIANKRVMVDRYNKVIGFDNIYAIGDIACMSTPKYPKGHPQVANVAIKQAKLLCSNLKQVFNKKT